MKCIKVKGISSKETERTINYIYPLFCENDYEAIAKVLRYADDEYTCEYDEKLKPITNSEYKEFARITSIEIIEE